MLWEQVPDTLDGWCVKLAGPARDVRRCVSNVLTLSQVGYYYHPELEKAALFAPLASAADLACCKAAVARAVGPGHVRSAALGYKELTDPDGRWVKVAYSPVVRRLGELLNFFPGQYPGGLPNHPSPLAAMLSSGLVGAGLGWGVGTLAGKVLPPGYGDRLGRTGAVLGGLAGAAPGALWGLGNKSVGRGLNDPSLLSAPAGSDPVNYPSAANGLNAVVLPKPDKLELPGYIEEMEQPFKQAADAALAGLPLGAAYRAACEKAAYAYGTFGVAPTAYGRTPVDVNINAIGQTLYDIGASPELAGTTMSTLYAAQQMPDPAGRPGWATGRQLGELARNAVGDYGKGLLVGAALNQVVGTPYRASTYGAAAAALGVLGAAIPKLFGD
jgi:hypothetical protein